jgi:hypothetical protein
MLLYTDAESSGHIAAVAACGPRIYYFDADVPQEVRKKLHHRLTQIVPFELIAGIVGLVAFSHLLEPGGRIVHFVDCKPALSILIKGYSKQADLADLVGGLWFRVSHLQNYYWATSVASASNIADGPSRRDFTLMKALGAERIQVDVAQHLQCLKEYLSRLDCIEKAF